jgi:hypothetical protein
MLASCLLVQKNLDCLRKRQAIANRERLVPIIQTVLFCGQQELALRGHRDGGALSLFSFTENDGNFRAALRLRLQAGDKVLKEHLENSAANATYLSWRTQNEIIEECGSIVVREIVSALGHGSNPSSNLSKAFFTLLADGTTDASGHEQFSVSIRYLNQANEMHEDFVQFIEVTDLSESAAKD